MALVTSVLLIAAQLVLPGAALAQDISMLPPVTLQWTAPDAVTVFVETPLGEGSVTVHRKKEGDEDDV